MMGMDFHGMKRKRLQALCKKHDIPANLKNKEMADRLSLIFKGKEIEDPVGSGNVGTMKDTPRCVSGKDINVEMIDLVTPGPGLEERSVVSVKNLKSSEIERLEFETNSSREITRGDFGICGVEEDMKSGLNEEQVVNSQGGLHSAPVIVAVEEFNKPLVEGEGEHLGGENNLLEDLCENGKERDEAVEQSNHNSPQGSNMKDVNVLHVSQEESGYPMVEEDEAAEQGHHNNPQANIKDVNVLHVSHEESGYPMVEEDEAAEQGHHNNPQASNIKDVNVLHVSHEESGYPMVDKEEAVEQGDNSSPQGSSSMKDVNVLHVSQEESGYPMVEEVQKSDDNIYNGSVYNLINKGFEVDAKDTDGKTNFTAEYCAHDVSFSLNIPGGTLDQFQGTYPENESNSSCLNIHQDTCEEELETPQKTGPIEDPGECIGFSPNNLEISAVKGFLAETYFDPSTLGDVEGTCNMKERTQSVKMEEVEHFIDEFHSSTFKDSYGTPVQFLTNDALNEVKSDLNIHEMIASDISDAKFVSSRKRSLRPTSETMIGFSPKQLNNSEIKVFQSEIISFPEPPAVDIGICDVEENMHIDVNKEQVDDNQQVIYVASSVMDLNKEDLVQVASVEVGDHSLEGEVEKSGLIADSEEIDIGFCDVEDNLQNDVIEEQADNEICNVEENMQNDVNEEQVDSGICDAEENLQNDVNEEQVDASQQVMHAASSVMVLKTEDHVQVASGEVRDHLLEVEKAGLIADSKEVDIGICDGEENIQIDVNKEQVIHAASVMVLNNEDLLQVASVEVRNHLLEGEVEKSGLINDSEEIDIGICDLEENMQINVNKEQVMHAASSVMDLNNEDLVQVASVEVGDNLLKEEVEKSGLLADSEECIGYMPNNLEPSATKGFQAATYFDSSTLGDVVGTCNIEESIESDQMEKEYSQEVLNMANELQRSMEESDPMEREVTRLFDNSDDHDDADGTEAEDKSHQHYIKSDMDSIEKYLLNDFQSIDDTDGQNSDEYAPTVPHSVEMKSCTFNLQQISASDTVSGDEGTFQEKLETPTKCTPIPSSEDSVVFYTNLESSMKKELIVKSLPMKRARDVLGASDMKENIKIAKKEQGGRIISRSAFPKRKPLQDLQQN
ncbi:hypothetical protein GLYMA_02G080700v4 [Glycine max]|uniref:Uncharacterized protein n=2 Tax=Glycine soja TaxID=3848 RepID=A0A445LL31_GLYSO|nr:uncharacterized protein LOC102661108 [Glycine max]XP_028199593.1 uncharacterized protein LOC114384125 [Glycine soja]KAG4401862.1 hypothetical protein GLYMA_02G080700v4 [Glycine max]KAH1059285.1 hypothetical protein GYH30_003368 [Glycine max]RZC23923.1 hypothetical protein D0Y65_003300 [Glycine soja]